MTTQEKRMTVGTEVVIIKAPANSPLVAYEGKKMRVTGSEGGYVTLDYKGAKYKVIGDERSEVEWKLYDRKQIASELQANLDEMEREHKVKVSQLKEEIMRYKDFSSDEAYAKSKNLTELKSNLVELGFKPKK